MRKLGAVRMPYFLEEKSTHYSNLDLKKNPMKQLLYLAQKIRKVCFSFLFFSNCQYFAFKTFNVTHTCIVFRFNNLKKIYTLIKNKKKTLIMILSISHFSLPSIKPFLDQVARLGFLNWRSSSFFSTVSVLKI